jgi:tetratricopeptide (TPR) repeat protein
MVRILTTEVLVTILITACAAGAQGPVSASKTSADFVPHNSTSFEVAQALAAKGRLDAALAQLDQLSAQNPEPAGVERLRGVILYQQQRLPEAVEAFTKAGAQDPIDRESIEMNGVSLYRLGRPVEALPFLEKAHVAVDRTNVDPQYVLGLCYTNLARYDDARRTFAAQYGFDPDSAEAHLLAGRLFLRSQLTDQATAQARKALEINADLPLAHQLLGEVALAKGDPPGAIHEFEAEQKLNPLNGSLYDRLGDAYIRNEQYTEAQQALNRAVLLEPDSTAPYILLGQAFLKLSQPIQALHYLDHAVKMDPSNRLTHSLLGQAYRATGQTTESNREFEQAVKLQQTAALQPSGKK